ncbi:hypothetical protein [Mycolicibacterium mageritense]|uniref:hypothetical protein n=1 Tax=Mycolicibacterium mageritense TaxID=53462 RepID=UPI0011D8372B|nr:hypothetical protein [Mycolicibacterium mageritense]TXI65329.1 MAG: hypothetical protein E6Q55_02665 [Mycolicibacterium mageritense]
MTARTARTSRAYGWSSTILPGEILSSLRDDGVLGVSPRNPFGLGRGSLSPIGLHDVTFDRSRAAAGDGDLDDHIAQALDGKGITDAAARASWREALRSVAGIPRIRAPM